MKTFNLNYEALEVIREIEGDIGIVAVSGSQRTGKSFILNLLLNRFNKGQGVSITYKIVLVQNKPLDEELHAGDLDMG